MVLMVPEMPVDLAATTGSGRVNYAPNAIVRTLTQPEMERHLGLYSGSGGTPSAFFITAISGVIMFLSRHKQHHQYLCRMH